MCGNLSPYSMARCMGLQPASSGKSMKVIEAAPCILESKSLWLECEEGIEKREGVMLGGGGKSQSRRKLILKC